MRKKWTKAGACLLLGVSLLSLTACSQGDTQSAEADTSQEADSSSISGIYTNTLTGEDMRDRLVASWSAVTHLDTLTQQNNLILTEANSTMDSDGDNVTLKTPEYYTWIYCRNGVVMGEPYVYQPVDPNSTENDGASFFGDYLDYHGYHRTDEMNVVVDRAEDTFTFDIAANDDSEAVGGESEDDGFSAGPIFNLEGAAGE